MQMINPLDSSRWMVLVAIPAEVVAAWACHMRASRYLLDGDVALGTFVSHHEVERCHHRFQREAAGGC